MVQEVSVGGTGSQNVARFGDVDTTADPEFYIRYVDQVSQLPLVRERKHKILDRLGLAATHHVLDVGCGTGDDVRAIAQVVGPGGRVVGVDNSQVMLTEAQRRSEGSGLSTEFVLGDAEHLHFPDNRFDACRSERTFMHVPDPERALAEMVRVTKPGGRIVVFDLDHDAWIVNGADEQLTRRFVALLSDAVTHGRIGRHLPGLFHRAGLADVVATPHCVAYGHPFATQIFGGVLAAAEEAGAVTAAEIAAWREGLAAAETNGSFFLAATGLIVSGRKP